MKDYLYERKQAKKNRHASTKTLPNFLLAHRRKEPALLFWAEEGSKVLEGSAACSCPTFGRSKGEQHVRTRYVPDRSLVNHRNSLILPDEGRLFLGAWHVFSWLMCYLRSLGTVFLCPQNHVPKALAALLGGVWLTKPHLGNPKWSKVTIHDGGPSCHCPSIFRGYKVSPKTHIIRAEKPVFFYALFNGLFDPHNSIMIGLLSSMVPPPVSFTT